MHRLSDQPGFMTPAWVPFLNSFSCGLRLLLQPRSLKTLVELKAHCTQGHINFEVSQTRLSLSKWNKGEKSTFAEHQVLKQTNKSQQQAGFPLTKTGITKATFLVDLFLNVPTVAKSFWELDNTFQVTKEGQVNSQEHQHTLTSESGKSFAMPRKFFILPS